MNASIMYKHSVRNFFRIQSKRCILSEAYSCEDAWQRRLDSPPLRNIKMGQYFAETDKKFGTKRLVSGVDIDLFANCVKDADELEELEHLLFRFRKTKRAAEMMDSTTTAVIRALLKYGNSDTLFRILENRDSYGVFPDFYCYNILMDNFLKQKQYKEAARIAILMMLQEDFSNPISQILGLYSCQKFVSECPSLLLKETTEIEGQTQEKVESDEDEEVTLVRVPFLRNPWFDDHFNIVKPDHLLGKTFYLIGREMQDTLGQTYQIIGLAMWEKWEKAFQVLQSMSESNGKLSLFRDAVEKLRQGLNSLPEGDDVKEKQLNRLEELMLPLERQICSGSASDSLEARLAAIPELEGEDMEAQRRQMEAWPSERLAALAKEGEAIDRERRLRDINEKRDYLFWKEKLLFFFENEDKVLDEVAEAEKLIEKKKSKKAVEDAYEPPEIVKQEPVKITQFMKLTRVKKL